MRIFYLCKRHYMNHDVIEDKYARLYEQPFQLAQCGNHVLACCLSYHPCNKKDEAHHTTNGELHWLGFQVKKNRLAILLNPFRLPLVLRKLKPELIIASSDCLHIILGFWLSKIFHTKFAADLYDDYETFGLSKIPFVKFFYRGAIRGAFAVSCVSQNLADHIRVNIGVTAHVLSLPSTINKDVFYPREKDVMRGKFSLPMGKKIFGTAGGLIKEKGIGCVYDAALKILEADPNVHFAVAGPTDPVCPPPLHERIHYLGKLTHAQVADFFCALDVGIVYLRSTRYGELSFPQKAYEMAACKIAMVVAEVGDMAQLFSRSRNELYCADNPIELEDAIQKQLRHPQVSNLAIDDWQEHGRKLNQFYLQALLH